MTAGGNWWRANEIVMRQLTRQAEACYRLRDKAIDIDPKTGAIVLNGPRTLDQKMARDLFLSAWPALEREWRDDPLFAGKDPRFMRAYAKLRRQFATIVRLVAKRASKTNSWDLATLEERMDYLRRYHWPTVSRNFPPEFVQSEYVFKSTFKDWSGIEPTEEERQTFLTEARKVYLNLP
jgi:hypothetical protein